MVPTTLATSIDAKLPCSIYPSAKYYLPQTCIAHKAVLLKLHEELTPGWALVRLTFDYTENWAKVRGWTVFCEWALFCETMV